MPETGDLEGAQCAVHTDTAAVATCQRCGCYVCERCLLRDPSGREQCQACGTRTLPARYFRYVWAIRLIGAVYLVAGSLTVLPAAKMVLEASKMIAMSFDSTPVLRLGAMTSVMFGLAAYLLLTGWKLRAFRPLARVFAIPPLAALLFAFPIGTLLGGSAILLLFGPGGKWNAHEAIRLRARDEEQGGRGIGGRARLQPSAAKIASG